MYCPKCGTQNSDDTRFCRNCGGNISLVLQAMSGEFPQERAVGWDAAGYPYDAQGRRIAQGPPSIGNGAREISIGILSLLSVIIIELLTRWPVWWLLFVIPHSIYFLSDGIGKIVQVRHEERSKEQVGQKTRALAEPDKREFACKEDYEQLSSDSVTEHTTLRLEPGQKE
jgi:zinc-ribbon domain